MSFNAMKFESRDGHRIADAVFFTVGFLFIYTQLFRLPFTPIYFEGDHLITITNAVRMMGGEIMYRDFFHLTPPGAEYVYETFFGIFGQKIWVLNFVIFLLGMAQLWLTWFLSKKVLSGYFIYVPSIVFFVIGFRSFLVDGSHRLFSVILVLAAVAILFGGRTVKRLAVAGILCGAASFFVQTRGLVGVVGIGAFLIWENYADGFDLKRLVRSCLALGLPALAVVGISHLWLIYQAGFDNYWFSLVTFLYRHYPNDPLAKSSAYLAEFPKISDYFAAYGTGERRCLGTFGLRSRCSFVIC